MKYFFLLLLFGFLCSNDLSAQVGINNPNPSQALDVGGKIKVGNDEIAPVAGTIRYNRVSKTFEGFDGTEWTIFNPEPEDDGGDGGSNIPVVGDQIRISLYKNSFFGGGDDGTFDQIAYYYGTGSFNYFLDVPAGQSIRVTSIIISPSSGSGDYELKLIPLKSDGIAVPAATLRLHNDQNYSTKHLLDPNGQLMIIPGGGKLEIEYEAFAGAINIIGFLE